MSIIQQMKKIFLVWMLTYLLKCLVQERKIQKINNYKKCKTYQKQTILIIKLLIFLQIYKNVYKKILMKKFNTKFIKLILLINLIYSQNIKKKRFQKFKTNSLKLFKFNMMMLYKINQILINIQIMLIKKIKLYLIQIKIFKVIIKNRILNQKQARQINKKSGIYKKL
ncbi:hypothetical protein IMG5_186790 [Ichthyophthirius multifiliis]|uniref:Uncharacterized protein n=1 Tax=Ichthyophthirius multifiliis TaxID=5932 RepID=G0R3P4_ICHMU|nr:hypothetical protein IMG5_186790 [Ichthyophthirius multifiliis]EGR27927.1 hypothetical protein IMG5_186790 [Ichthyophthirius multifiliis]|eukprot:XP_004027272.1 hypothetical protein IMG5_186790 [Ichthyophthirius multifiliis]